MEKFMWNDSLEKRQITLLFYETKITICAANLLRFGVLTVKLQATNEAYAFICLYCILSTDLLKDEDVHRDDELAVDGLL